MAADLHIHVLTDEFTEEHYKAFASTTMGSKYFGGFVTPSPKEKFEQERNCDLYLLCGRAPNVWVGQVSWLKAGLFEDDETYVPDTVAEILEGIGEVFPIIDDELIRQVRAAFELPNKTVKDDGVWDGKGYSLADVDTVVTFLKRHKGERAFTISW